MKTLNQNIHTATILPIGVITVTTNGSAVDTYLSGRPAYDSGLIDIAIGDLEEVTAAWVATTAYALDDYVRPVAGQGAFVYKCTTAGTSGAAEPTWPTVDGQTVADGSAVWTAVERKTKVKVEVTKRKKELKESPEAQSIRAKMKEYKEDLRDIEESLSNQLVNLFQITGVKEFETVTGEVREFVIKAKVKAKKG